VRDIATLCGIWTLATGEGAGCLVEPDEHYCEYFAHAAQVTRQIGHEWNLRSDGDGRVIKTRGAADRRKKPPLSVVPTIMAVAITAATRLMDGREHQ
jgi:hypothetical protein